eukprot:m.10914 g.10914  ORF g.10914 m.10914 type:complete len:246 (-) comp14460_c0_seq1:53-790(-)
MGKPKPVKRKAAEESAPPATPAAKRGAAAKKAAAKEPPAAAVAVKQDGRPRCSWATGKVEMVEYHDTEWGVPSHDDRHLFEMLCLEGQQAGLSWATVLAKRAHYKEVFHDFHPARVAKMTGATIAQLLKDAGLIRNTLKLHAIVKNANAFLAVQEEFGTFDKYVWSFVGNKPIPYDPSIVCRATSDESDKLSKDLLKRGFKFVGSTIMYAFMQACGLVQDHPGSCFLGAAPSHAAPKTPKRSPRA